MMKSLETLSSLALTAGALSLLTVISVSWDQPAGFFLMGILGVCYIASQDS
ncbi:hypothetical protein [Pseudobacteriovorax antillogorgiicola]|uniref:Uncharacterized protein n=1 Tax=Pseudobacteriovorax antillogorgiicola TaxID=1513793 RepID=A0A1Y6CGY6_9BACT|nr:hypothetical protein [Pseudobacteriovorax antillogorgiicola]TCS47240.1 hypothetical protein EDD56_12113 [Pseudobacteriovorax antillogorgiicola]SMF61988.1 hypothetical protein SAMN06296036_12113 [Pseudobacteriovorax antillogorgiicola]